MAKLIILITVFTFLSVLQASTLEKECLSCHQKQGIPSQLIYKRYLMRYSTDSRMQSAIYHYLQHPQQEHSIMPKVFFTKFPMKPKNTLDEQTLQKNILLFLQRFNIKKKLTNSH